MVHWLLVRVCALVCVCVCLSRAAATAAGALLKALLHRHLVAEDVPLLANIEDRAAHLLQVTLSWGGRPQGGACLPACTLPHLQPVPCPAIACSHVGYPRALC